MLPDELEEYWHAFRRSLVRRDRSPATVEVYRKSFEQLWHWALDAGVKPDPAAVDHTIINDWTDHLLDAPAMRNGRPVFAVDPMTGERVARRIESSTRIRYVNRRPFSCGGRASLMRPTRSSAPIPLEHVRRLLGVYANKDFVDRRDNALIRVLFDTGARLGELVALTTDDWDRRADVLALRGKTGHRVVPVSAATCEALGRYFRARKEHPKATLPALWLSGKGALGESGVAQVLKRRCGQAGIAPIHPHQARHTFAHNLYAFDAHGTTNCSGTPKTCTPLWTASTGGIGVVSWTPAVANGIVYAPGNDRNLYVFDATGHTNCSMPPAPCAGRNRLSKAAMRCQRSSSRASSPRNLSR